MNERDQTWQEARQRIIGLGETSARKSYYAELIKKLDELKASEADLRMIFNSTHDAIIIHDFEGRVQDANEPMLGLFRVTREESLRYVIADYSATKDQVERLPGYWAELKESKRDLVFEWLIRRPLDGSIFESEVALRLADWKGTPMVVAVVRDVTQRKNAERERLKLEEQLSHARKLESVGQLAGGVAHDFNNMLTPILSYSSMIYEEMADENPLKEDMQQIVHSAERARDLVKQLLAFARKQTLQVKPTDLNAVVSNMYRMMQRTLRENVKLSLMLARDLRLVECDAGQIEQVLLNLCLNAQDAMPDGGDLSLETRLLHMEEKGAVESAQGTYACLLVKDSGVGMSASVKAKIFEPFFTTKDLGRGTGLGLSIVYGIVQQHGGFIEIESEPGKGTLFRVLLPVKEVIRGGMSSQDPNVVGKQGGKDVGILLVEDQDEVRLSIKRLLERHGYRVLAANGGAQALELIKGKPDEVSLLVSDVILAGENGKDLYEKLLLLNPSLRVLFISGYPAEVIGTHGVLESGISFLQKPFKPSEIIERIGEIINARRG